jgi:starch phosphorylase
MRKAAALAQWRRALQRGWPQVKVEAVEANGADPMHVGGQLQVKARVNLGGLSPDDVVVQLFHGALDNLGEIPQPATVPMSHNAQREGSVWEFKGTIPCRASGQHGFAVRVLPRHEDLANPFEPGLVCWG